jgi:phosphoglycerate dehydrogenase-like enzyme
VSRENDAQNELCSGLTDSFPGLDVVRIRTMQEAPGALAGAEILFAFLPSVDPSLLRAAPALRWIQLLGSGLDGVADLAAARPDLLITSGRGAQAEPVSEAVIAFMFALARDLPRLVEQQRQRLWQRRPARLLKSATVVTVGVGAIAGRLAPKCAALGMRVLGVSSAPRAVEGFERIAPLADLREAAAEADYLVVLTPLSDSSRMLVGREVLAAMKTTACLINVARGGIVDEAALAEALTSGRIAGAALDVFAEEPLPASSALWSCPNVLISPHLGGLNTRYLRDLLPLLTENTRRFLAGETGAMRNVVERGGAG